MRTESQHRASRVNGAHSHGPTSAQGKSKSAKNSVKHGLTARNPILLTIEDRDAFQAMHEEYLRIFSPANLMEREMVDEMVSVQWRRQRAEALEAATLDAAIYRMDGEGDPVERAAEAYDVELHRGRTLENLQRLAERLSRQYLRLLKTFQGLRERPIPAPVGQDRQNEPKEGEVTGNEESTGTSSPRRGGGGRQEAWVPVMHAIVGALKDFPEAREKVLEAIRPITGMY